MDFKNLKKKIREPKVSRLLPNLCDLLRKIHRLGYRFKNLWKIYRLAYGFLLFVIPISVQEIAMNVVWTKMEYENMTQGHLDYGTTMTGQSVCEVFYEVFSCKFE